MSGATIVICCRVDDPDPSCMVIPGFVVGHCANCDHPIRISPDTIPRMVEIGVQPWCVQCVAQLPEGFVIEHEFSLDSRYRTVRLPEILGEAFGISRSEARRKIDEGGVRIDGEKYMWLTCAAMDIDGKLLQVGKRKFARIRVA